VGTLLASAGPVDLLARVVQTEAGSVSLSELESRLVAYLSEQQERTVSREELLEQVWGYSPHARSRTVEVTIQRVRSKIEKDPMNPVSLVTVRGGGYAWRQASPPPRALALPRLEAGALVGRAGELEQLHARLQMGRLVTLTGPPGVGKTWLARRLATELAQERPTWFVAVGGCRTEAELLGAALGALGGPREPTLAALAQLTDGTVGVLDEAQELEPEAASLLTRWLQAAPSARLLVTSQRLLGLELEQRQALEPLSDQDGALLLRRRLSALGLPALEEPVLLALSARAGGLPLALELLAPLLEVWPVERLLQVELLDLSADRPDLPLRHRSLRAALTAATDALAPGPRELLVRLSALQGSFDLEAAERLGGSAGDLAVLTRRSLVYREGGGRLALYEAVRSWGRWALQQDAALAEEVHERHTDWLLALEAQAARDHQRGLAFEPVRADLVWALRHARISALAPLARALADLVHRKGPLSSLPPLLGEILERPLPPEVRARLLEVRSNARRWTGDLAGAEADAREALRAPAQGPGALAGPWCSLAAVLEQAGREQEGIEAAERAVELARAAGEDETLHLALAYLGGAWSNVQPARARLLHEQAAEVALRCGARDAAAIALANAANLYPDSEAAQGLQTYRRVLGSLEGGRHPHFEAVVWGNLAVLEGHLGDFAAAERAHARAAQRLHALGDVRTAAVFELSRAACVARAGSPQRALAMLRAAEPVLRSVSPPHASRARAYLALLARDVSLLDPEATTLEEAAASLLRGVRTPEGLDGGDLELLEALLRL
jgi:predicted ATPase